MRTDMCRQIGPCFVLNSQSFTTKTLKQCVLDLSEAMRRVQISTCGEKTIQKGVWCSSARISIISLAVVVNRIPHSQHHKITRTPTPENRYRTRSPISNDAESCGSCDFGFDFSKYDWNHAVSLRR